MLGNWWAGRRGELDQSSAGEEVQGVPVAALEPLHGQSMTRLHSVNKRTCSWHILNIPWVSAQVAEETVCDNDMIMIKGCKEARAVTGEARCSQRSGWCCVGDIAL